MPATVARQEDHLTPGQLSGQKTVRRRAEWRFDLHPFLFRETVEMIETTAADDADSIRSHEFEI